MAWLREIVVDCRHAASLARFWAQVLDGYAVRAYDEDEIQRLAGLGFTHETDPSVALDGPGPTFFFTEVPEPKAGKNRLHVDVVSTDRRNEVARLVALGASARQEYDGWTTLADPEGNEFCVTDPRDAP
ncbi:VOC family protein [Actinopolymorpha sp. NPDC004070]|uniref:VOC family protein n=1 Tax=Actinopolymorpha sp. NPDC004070 TaxID=3154548 RepID=UPI0033B65519